MTRDSATPADRKDTTFTRLMPRTTPVKMVTLFEDLIVETDGTVNPVYDPLCLPELEYLGPLVLEFRAHTNTEEAGPEFKWQLLHEWTWDGVRWFDETQVFAFTSAGPGAAIHPAETDRSKFGRQMRFKIACKNQNAGAVNSASLTCMLAIQFAT